MGGQVSTGAGIEFRRITPGFAEYAVSFPSRFSSPDPTNNVVHLSYFRPHGSFPRRPAVVVLHSLGAANGSTERALCAHLADHGIAAALLALPYHLGRRPPGIRTASHLLDPNPERMVAFFEQAQTDVDAAIDWLERRAEIDPGRIGLVGISLGAVVGALSVARDDRLRANVLVLGGGDVAHILSDGALTFFARRRYRRRGVDEELLRRALAPVEPLAYARPLPPSRRLLMINARYDLVLPHQDTLKLWEAFGRPPILWLETGHYGPQLISDRLNEVIEAFLAAHFNGQSWQAPRSLSVLTLRVGLLTGHAPVLTPVVTLDLARLSRQPDLRFGAGLRSSGPLLAVSLGLSRGLDLMVATYLFRGRARPRPFLFWHVVL